MGDAAGEGAEAVQAFGGPVLGVDVVLAFRGPALLVGLDEGGHVVDGADEAGVFAVVVADGLHVHVEPARRCSSGDPIWLR